MGDGRVWQAVDWKGDVSVSEHDNERSLLVKISTLTLKEYLTQRRTVTIMMSAHVSLDNPLCPWNKSMF